MDLKNKKHLQFYMQCMHNNKMPTDGLCFAAELGHIDRCIIEYMMPTDDDEIQLIDEELSAMYWACGEPDEGGGYGDTWRVYEFTPLRQTIVLLMAAINNEL